jgi:hypothetical protein
MSQQKIACMWKAYKKHQTAFYVAKVCNISRHTAQKYIESGTFAVRFSKLKIKASAIADDAQADAFAQDLIKLGNIKTLLSDAIETLLENKELNPSIADLDKVMRLMFFIRGEPDQRREEVFDFSWLVEEEEEEDSDDSTDQIE